MKVRIISTNEIVEAKRFSELTEEEKEISLGNLNNGLWESEGIFVHVYGFEWVYMYDWEVEIL